MFKLFNYFTKNQNHNYPKLYGLKWEEINVGVIGEFTNYLGSHAEKLSKEENDYTYLNTAIGHYLRYVWKSSE